MAVSAWAWGGVHFKVGGNRHSSKNPTKKGTCWDREGGRVKSPSKQGETSQLECKWKGSKAGWLNDFVTKDGNSDLSYREELIVFIKVEKTEGKCRRERGCLRGGENTIVGKVTVEG